MELSGGASGRRPRLLLVAGATRTAAIEGISAAGADPSAMAHTPGADAEICTYGRPVRAPVVPVSPSGCPTPAVVTRAVRELVSFPVTVIDAGLDAPTAAPTVTVGGSVGADLRTTEPVPDAAAVFASARDFGQSLPDDAVLVGETIPGGTTTALGVLRALGEDLGVSSSLPANPIDRKADVVAAGLDASGLDRGAAAGDPVRACRLMGDPVLATVAGLVVGLTASGTHVTLAGGTQLLTAAALARHAGVDEPLSLATTAYVAADETVALDAAAQAVDVNLTVTDPAFEVTDHPATDAYVAGEAKEGVGMGGALALAAAADVSMAAVRRRVTTLTDDLLADDGSHSESSAEAAADGGESTDR
jgi:uncharacterized protein (TIGR00303 family)